MGEKKVNSTSEGQLGVWPMAGHDPQNTSRSEFSGPVGEVTFSPIDAQASEIRGGISISHQGKVFIGQFKPTGVACLNLDGEVQWTATTPYPLSTAPAIDADGNVYLGSSEVTKLDGSGNPIWTTAISGVILQPMVLVQSKQMIFAMTNSSSGRTAQLYGINIETGEISWQLDTGGDSNTGPGVSLDRETIYLGFDWNGGFSLGSLRAYSTSDGSLKWQYPSKNNEVLGQVLIEPRSVSGPILIDDLGNIYFVENFAGNAIHSITADGQGRWRLNVGSFGSSSLALSSHGIVYVSAVGLVAVNATDGTKLWETPTPDNQGTYPVGPVTDLQGNVFFGAFYDNASHHLYAYDKTGSLLWEKTLAGRYNGGAIDSRGRFWFTQNIGAGLVHLDEEPKGPTIKSISYDGQNLTAEWSVSISPVAGGYELGVFLEGTSVATKILEGTSGSLEVALPAASKDYVAQVRDNYANRPWGQLFRY